jgi:hypothetical protein
MNTRSTGDRLLDAFFIVVVSVGSVVGVGAALIFTISLLREMGALCG